VNQLIAHIRDRRPATWVYVSSGLFILLNALLIAFEFYYLPILPVVIAVALVALLALDKLVLLIVFLTPVSINLTDVGMGVGMTLPTDPLMFGVLVIFLLKLLIEKGFPAETVNHPITLAILIQVTWIAITCISSEMPVVSIKFLISRMWYLATFYFVATQLFKDFSKVKWFVGLYIASFTGIICYTIIRHWMYGFQEQPAHWVMEPFFKDHTSYGAALAMFYPLLIGLTFMSSYNRSWKILFSALLLLFTVAIVLSYTRAAWISLAGALGVFIVMWFRIRFTTVMALGLGALAVLALSWSTIVMELEKNRQDSSAEFTEHLQSVTNISTDASNLERLNRWGSAWRMFKERPAMGWGPGTYAFQYAPFQLASEKTIISTNAGDAGNAHSEYIGPLSEMGLFGMLSFLLVVGCIIYYAVRLYVRIEDREHRLYMVCMFLGLVTYMMHGMLNNFLDTDKISAPFWGFTAAIVALDVYHTRKAGAQAVASDETLE
jgi:putative inorganic carbon (hco3(-)) transporter